MKLPTTPSKSYHKLAGGQKYAEPDFGNGGHFPSSVGKSKSSKKK